MTSSVTSIINDTYLLEKLLGSGKFGEIYLGRDINNDKEVAIKLESKANNYVTLKNEANILKYLYDNRCSHVPLLYWFGNYNHKFVIIVSKYDCSLYDYALNNSISQNTVNIIMVKLISIIEDIHSLFIVHRDIKPHHFMIKNNNLYLIDFGISTFYVNENREHKQNIKGNYIIGSPNYLSFFLHEGNSFSRRDDMISIGYIYIFLIKKTLPWENLNVVDKEYSNVHILHKQNQLYKEMKSLDEVNKFANQINNNLVTYFSFCYYLNFYDEPNYIENIALFHE
tara:strand:- start:14155 stop:15003 length:849 start_codon:yes stop_codon:yes gene_type:complete